MSLNGGRIVRGDFVVNVHFENSTRSCLSIDYTNCEFEGHREITLSSSSVAHICPERLKNACETYRRMNIGHQPVVI